MQSWSAHAKTGCHECAANFLSMVGSNKVMKIFNKVIKIFNQKHWPVIVTFEPLRFFQVQIDILFISNELDISIVTCNLSISFQTNLIFPL